MTQIRCIQAINEYQVNDIVDVPDTGITFGFRGVPGGLIIDDLGEGPVILFVVDDAVDSVEKKVRVQGPDSLHGFFSFDLTIPNPDEPPVTLNCALTALLETTPPSRTYNNGINTFRLVPANPSLVLEFATERQGITKAGAAIVGIVYYRPNKNADGSYSIEVNATGLVETILIRQVGCTSTNINPNASDFYGGRFHAYITDSSGEVEPPPTGDKLYGPIGAFRWDGFFEDYGLSPRQGIGGQVYDQGINHTSKIRLDLTEFASANVVPFFGEQNLTPESIPIITKVVWNPTSGVNDLTIVNKNVTCKFNLTPTAMQKEIAYAKDAGIDFWAFLWYSPYDSPMAEAMHKFVSSSDKMGMKMCFTAGPIGWNPDQNIDYMADKMNQDYYQRIDGKPLFFAGSGWINDVFRVIRDENGNIIGTKTLLQLVQDAYATKSGGGQLYVCELGNYNTYPNTSQNASTVYLTVGIREPSDGFISELPHSKINTLEVTNRNIYMNNSTKDIIPCLTTGALNFPKRSSLSEDVPEYWTAAATGADMDAKHASIIAFRNANPRCKAVMYYSWNENHESGNPICPTLAPGTTSVNVATINTAGATSGVNRSTLDKVKQYCKK